MVVTCNIRKSISYHGRRTFALATSRRISLPWCWRLCWFNQSGAYPRRWGAPYLTTLSLFIFSLSFNQISDSKKLWSRDVRDTQRSFAVFVSVSFFLLPSSSVACDTLQVYTIFWQYQLVNLCHMFFCSSSYGKAADCFAQGGMLMVLLPHSLLLSMPHTYYGSIELLSRMSAFLLKKLLYYFLIITVFSFLKAHSLSRQHRPYPKEGAWHRLRHFTLSALRLPEDAMQLNYNPGLDHSYCTRSRILMFAQNGTQFLHKKCFRNPKVSARIGLMAPATTNVTWYVPSFVVHWFIITKLECSWNGSQVYQPQWLGHEFSLFPHVHSLKPIAECIEGTFLTISKGALPSFWPIEFSDGGESARWGLVFRVLEQQQQAILALQRQLNANG